MGVFFRNLSLFIAFTFLSLSAYAQTGTTTVVPVVVEKTTVPATTTTTGVVTVPARTTTTGVVTVPAATTTVVPATTTTTAVVPATTSSSVYVERPVLVTTIPAPKTDTVVTPANPTHCFWIDNGWYGDVWVGRHRVCQYANNPSGTLWVEGYWTCNKYDLTEAKCTNWDWTSGHWANGFTVY